MSNLPSFRLPPSDYRLPVRGSVPLRCLPQAPVDLLDVANELAIEMITAAGHADPEEYDAAGVPVEDELQALLTEALLRSPALVAYLDTAGRDHDRG